MSSSYMAVGYDCNYNCICCPLTTFDRLHRSLGYEDMKKQLDVIYNQKGEKHIVLSGGEPMLHTHFLDIIKLAGERGFSTTILSNVSMCKNQEFVSNLVECAGKNKFDIVTAIHSSFPEVHDGITGVNGSLMETLEALDNLVLAKVPVTIKHIFNKKSLPTLVDTFVYLEQHFPPQVSFQFCTMDYSGRAAKNIPELFVTMREIQLEIERLLDYLEQHMSVRRNVSIIEAPLCMTDPYYWKYFKFFGSHLDSYIAPNVGKDLISFDVPSECGSYYNVCINCAVKKICDGTWKSAYNYFGSDLLCPIYAVANEE